MACRKIYETEYSIALADVICSGYGFGVMPFFPPSRTVTGCGGWNFSETGQKHTVGHRLLPLRATLRPYMRTLYGLLLSLFTLTLESQPACGSTINYNLAGFQGYPTCIGSLTASPVATVSVATCNGSGAYTASELGWTASVTGDAGSPGNMDGNVSGSAVFAPTVFILGGSGSGFFQVEYSDELHLSPLALEGSASISAGDLSEDVGCSYNNDFCAISLTDNFSSGWIPFTFGEVVELPAISASFSFGCTECGGNFTASESVTTFDIVDANMVPIPGAYALQTPEPNVFFLCGIGLAILAGLRRYQRSSLI